MPSEKDPRRIAPLLSPDEMRTVAARERGARQRIDEARRSLEALLADVQSGVIEGGGAIGEKIVELQRVLENTTDTMRREAPSDAIAHKREGEALADFVHFTERMHRRVEAEAKFLRHKEVEFRDGILSVDEYRVISDQRERLYAEIQDSLLEHARGVNTESRQFKEAVEYVRQQLAPLHELRPLERLDQLWRKFERGLIPFIQAYDLIRTNPRSRGDLRGGLVAAWTEKKEAYDRFARAVAAKRGLTSDEREELLARATALLRPQQPLPKISSGGNADGVSVSFSDVAHAHQRAISKYVDVQHRLSVDQRITMRKQIAQLSSLVERAEISHVISHATEHAPSIAHASLVSMSKRVSPSPTHGSDAGFFTNVSKLLRRG
ncbi:MAG: hypothetical protein KBC02_00575 [Candidatus Pacebacteria bacterium]|nr:hypothetical protein [Candidatus Paceibacterota bacterium]